MYFLSIIRVILEANNIFLNLMDAEQGGTMVKVAAANISF